MNETITVNFDGTKFSEKIPSPSYLHHENQSQESPESERDYRAIETVERANRVEEDREESPRMNDVTSNSVTHVEPTDPECICPTLPEKITPEESEKEEDLWALPAHPVRPGSNLNSFQSNDTKLKIEDLDRRTLKHIIAVSLEWCYPKSLFIKSFTCGESYCF